MVITSHCSPSSHTVKFLLSLLYFLWTKSSGFASKYSMLPCCPAGGQRSSVGGGTHNYSNDTSSKMASWSCIKMKTFVILIRQLTTRRLYLCAAHWTTDPHTLMDLYMNKSYPKAIHISSNILIYNGGRSPAHALTWWGPSHRPCPATLAAGWCTCTINPSCSRGRRWHTAAPRRCCTWCCRWRGE